MRNNSPSRSRTTAPPPGSTSRRPTRYPRRGLAALILTVAGLTLLVSFRSPSDLAVLATTEVLPPSQARGGEKIRSLPAADRRDGATGENGTGHGAPATASSAPATASSGQDGRADVSASQPDPGSNSGSAVADAEQVITGQTVRTRFGPVQVQVTLAGNAITDVEALQLPYDHPQSARISRIVEPMLQEEALRVQFDSSMRLVSGATYTSRAYATSLQSALDQLG